MTQPRVPGASDSLELPCGERVHPHDLDMGVREFDCDCGESHAVVMDVHPLSRFVPEFLVDTLQETIETEDEFEQFTTAHAMAMAHEEFPEKVVRADCSDDGYVGYALLWVAEFQSRRLHEIIVELLVDLMAHAISHADETTAQEFETYLTQFDITEFVETYREKRNFEDEYDTAI